MQSKLSTASIGTVDSSGASSILSIKPVSTGQLTRQKQILAVWMQ
jgi:hypothetical protein